MYYADDDGAAVVYDIPVRPFLLVQHMQVDVTAVNRLVNYSLAAARERGWLQTDAAMQRATDYMDDNDARPLVEQEGYAPKGEDRTVFYVGLEVQLATTQPHFRRPAIPSTVLLWARLQLSYVGTSSYAVRGLLCTYTEGKMSEKTPLATFCIACVEVSNTLRAAVPLSPTKRHMLESTVQRGGSTEWRECATPPPARLTRLDVAALLRQSSWLSASNDAKSEVATTSSTTSNAKSSPFSPLSLLQTPAPVLVDGTPLTLTHQCTYALRESDMDFNHHVNQLANMQLVINTFRAAVASATSVYARLLNSYADVMRADLLIRAMRIDYVREIPMHHVALEVYLFPLNDEARSRLVKSTEGSRLNELAEVGFFTLGVPTLSGEVKGCTARSSDNVTQDTMKQGKYIATVGVLSVAV